MEIILLKRVEKLGQMGDVVTVKPGYARNYLLPQGFADRATEARIAEFQARKQELEAENLKQKQDAEHVAGKVGDLVLTFIKSASEAGALYGAISTREIVESAKNAGLSIDRKQVVVTQPIKSLGLHQVEIHLHPEVSVLITLNIALSEEEARKQANTLKRPQEGREDGREGSSTADSGEV